VENAVATGGDSPREVPLRGYVAMLRRRRFTVAGSLLLAVGASLGLSAVQTPIYKARTTLLLQQRQSENLFSDQNGVVVSDRDRTVQTEIGVLETSPVEQVVQREIGGQVPHVQGKAAGKTDLVYVQVQDKVAARAAKIADAYARAYINYRRTQTVDDLTQASSLLSKKVTDLDAQIAATKDPNEKSALIQQQSVFKQQVDQLQVNSQLNHGGAQVVAPAKIPTVPIRPRPARDAALGGLAGLVIGAALAFLREYLDDTIKDKRDLERALGGAPTLGLIPAVTAWRDSEESVVISLREPASAEAEAYRTLRTSISFASLDRSLKTILITSGKAGEGKTTTAANLAVALARAGRRVILASADLRRPRLHLFFGLENEDGLTSVIVGEADLAHTVRYVPDVPNLAILNAGSLPANPSELLAGNRMGALLRSLAEGSEFVIVDSPPLLPVSDAVALAGMVDGVVLVASVRQSTRREMARCKELLDQVDAQILGTVLNQVRGETGFGYGYGAGRAHSYTTPAGSNGRRSRNGADDSAVPDQPATEDAVIPAPTPPGRE